MPRINCTKKELERRIALCEKILEAYFLHTKGTEGVYNSSRTWVDGYEKGKLSAYTTCLETFREIICEIPVERPAAQNAIPESEAC